MRRLAVVLALLTACGGASSMEQAAAPSGTVVFPDGTRVRVEIADTEATRQRGLMFRDTLAVNEGMVFVFEARGFYPFWMKNTLIPLDILWLDTDGRVVSIARSVPPCRSDPCPTYPPDAEASYVVELVSGFAQTHAVRVGSVLEMAGIP